MMEKGELILDKSKTCACTGHRKLPQDFDYEKLKKDLLVIVESGYTHFLIGMAIGFDTACFKALYSLKLKGFKEIKLIGCIPCLHQSKRFSLSQKKEYDKLINLCDERVLISRDYTPYCMQKRNVFMVDNCSLLFAYFRGVSGGTKNTIEYAKQKLVDIIFV